MALGKMSMCAETIANPIYNGFCWVSGSFFCQCVAKANWKILKSPWHFIVDLLSTSISKAAILGKTWFLQKDGSKITSNSRNPNLPFQAKKSFT